MGRILLVGRLAVRDLRRRRIEAALLLLAIMAATTTLTLGLVLRDAASDPYQSTREATNGPDVVASVSQPAELSSLEELAGAPGVIDHSRPYPVTPAELQASDRTSAMPPYPGRSCIVAIGCINGAIPNDQAAGLPPGMLHNPGLVWLTQADARSLTPDPDSLSYVMNLKLADPDAAQAFVDANHGEHGGAAPMQPWENILEDATELARDSQILLLIGA